VTEAQAFAPAPSRTPADPQTGRDVANALRTNGITSFPPEAFEEDMVFRRFFGRPQIILNRPSSIHHILVENPANYRRSPAGVRILRPLLGTGLLLSEGEAWRYQRRTIAPAFAPRTLPLLAVHVARAVDAVVAGLEASAEREVDLLVTMQSLALEVAGTSMFSVAMDRYRPELRDLITRYAASLGRPSLLDFLLPPAIPSPRDLARRRFRRRWVDLIGRIIAERRRKGSESAPRDLFDLLSDARDPESGIPFSAEALIDQVATLIAAGHETTGVALFWSLYLVAGAPAVEQRLSAEVASLDLGPNDAAESLPKLVYTRAAVQEALRLYPPAFNIVRQARKADNAGGVEVPIGGIVFISPWVLHRHRRLWTQPELFDPSRFLPDATPPDRFAYLPFGVGPRICIGAQFALTEATLVLARIMQAFRIERVDDDPVLPVGMVTTQPHRHPLFRMLPRA
jgi:cytochrome P450